MASGKEARCEKHDNAIANDLLNLYDEISECNDCCSFMWAAFASLAVEDDALDSSTIEGLKCLADWMKQRMAAIKARVASIHERAAAETVDETTH